MALIAAQTIMTTEPQNADAVLSKLIENLEANGEISEKEHRRLILLAITGLYYILMPLPAKVRKLESHNLILWIKQHPKISGLLLTLSILLAMFFHEVSPWVMGNLKLIAGIP